MFGYGVFFYTIWTKFVIGPFLEDILYSLQHSYSSISEQDVFPGFRLYIE
jgi:hypothetical protein